MSSKKKSSPRFTTAELQRVAFQQGKALFESGLRQIESLPDGPRKTWVVGVKKSKDDSDLLMKELRRDYPNLEWPEQLAYLGIQYQNAVPTLLHWLPRVENPLIKGSIAIALGQAWIGRVGIDAIGESIATILNRPLTPDAELAIQSMINSMVSAASDEDLPLVVEICQNQVVPDGAVRVLIDLLGRRRTKGGADALFALMATANEQQRLDVVRALLKNRSAAARKYVEELNHHPLASIRKEIELKKAPISREGTRSVSSSARVKKQPRT